MRIEAIAIGTELLATRRLDTNSVWIGERLGDLGLAFHRKSAVGDSRGDLRDLFQEALGRSELIVCTGGLGPTFDDFTKEVWAEVLGVPLKEDPACRAELEAWFASRRRLLAPSNYKQALLPEGAVPLLNPLGTAPGVWWEPASHPGRRIVLLPGVPREMKRMWVDQVEPRLRPLAGRPVRTLRVVVAGVPESLLDERTQAIRERHAHLDWTILASLTQVEFVVRHEDGEGLRAAEAELEAELGEDLVCVGEGHLEGAVLDRLQARGESLALAESVTGGLIASRLTAVPGASRALRGGAVVYTPEAKRALGGLDEAFLREHGTIGEATTLALARHLRASLGATWGLAITGNAGPGADPEGDRAEAHPVGSVVMAVVGPDGEELQAFSVPGEREDVQLRAAGRALDLLRRKLR